MKRGSEPVYFIFLSLVTYLEYSLQPFVLYESKHIWIVMGCSHYKIKASYKVIDALVLAINKPTCLQNKRIRQIKDQ